MSDKELLIVGDGPLRLELEKKSSDNIKFIGQIRHDEVMSMIKEAKAVIVPSQCYETFGMVIIESFTNGTPVIVGDIGNITGLVDEGITGLKFRYDSVEDLLDAVRRFENAEAAEMGEQAYRDYRAKYTPEANYERLRRIYDEVL